MSTQTEFYRVKGSKVYFSPDEALAAGYKTLPFVELFPGEVLEIVQDAFQLEISALREAQPLICDVLPTLEGEREHIVQLKEISARHLISELDAGHYLTAIFESDELFIAIFGSDETWVIHSRQRSAEIFRRFSELLDFSRHNAEVLGRSAIFAPYFDGAV